MGCAAAGFPSVCTLPKHCLALNDCAECPCSTGSLLGNQPPKLPKRLLLDTSRGPAVRRGHTFENTRVLLPWSSSGSPKLMEIKRLFVPHETARRPKTYGNTRFSLPRKPPGSPKPMKIFFSLSRPPERPKPVTKFSLPPGPAGRPIPGGGVSRMPLGSPFAPLETARRPKTYGKPKTY